MNRLESRKQLLLSESELNRALLIQQCQTVSFGYQAMTEHASAYGALAASAGAMIKSKFSSSSGHETVASNATTSKADHVLKTTQLVLDIWQEVRYLRGK